MKIDRLARLLPVLFLVVMLPGCVTYWPKTPPEPGATASFPGIVRVTRADATSTLLVDARVQGDSLRGTVQGDPTQEVAIALADVKQVAVREHNGKATVALMLVSALLAYGAWVAILYVSTTT
ncbi:MAG TPA: hypothetical protein VF092_15690 [Longimicrobium sp.]